MRIALLCVFLLFQGVPIQQGGKVTGTLRDSQGMPLPGVRMAAVTRGAAIEDAATGGAMAGLAETDELGRFTLEDIPPGRYSIAAGRLDLQTYYPGTQSLATATILTVGAGETIAGINFALNDTSFGRTPGYPTVAPVAPVITAVIPVSVNTENGGKMPISANGRLVTLRVESTTVRVNLPIEGGAFVVPGPVATDFRVDVENLPDGFEVKSIRYGSTSIPQGVFQLTAANFATVRTARSTNLPNVVLQSLTTSANSSLVPAINPPASLFITIGETDRPSTSGVRVSGYAGNDKRRVYISGRPGIVFSDGSFEFRGVPPGRHLITSVGGSGPLATILVVGSQDVSKIALNEINMLPDDFRDPRDPMPAGNLPPGTIAAPVRITGTVIEENSKSPITEGEISVRSGGNSLKIPIDSNGRFETFKLLPGTYELRLQIFGHSSVAPTVTIEDKDIDLEISTRRLF